ncbi:hypothetical protein BC936DRAFT_144928 [Jimgerdemannia flammicorona]|uniref:Uncharacterized protein n=1 Tax=Jimgerdemannia flammicorona TaxID=994334 RepID=A0A433DBC4_9FUNG|nr:hypothetical protein BC936DRAFT_144928 [Jimgerdemannia flammicorona]
MITVFQLTNWLSVIFINRAEDTLPPDFPIPAGPEDCGCEDHLEKKEVELELNMSAHRLFDLMFSDAKAPMTWEKLNKQRGNTGQYCLVRTFHLSDNSGLGEQFGY